MNGHWIALLSAEGLPQPVRANSNWMKIRAHVGISLWLVLLLWPPPLHVVSFQIAGSPRTLPSSRIFHSLHGTPLFIRPESILPSGVLTAPVSFVPCEVWEQLFIACDSSDVDASWRLRSREAEACLARAYLTAGGPAS